MSSQLQREFGLAEQCRGHEHLTRSTEQYPATSAVVRCRPRGALAFAAIMPSASRTGRYPGAGKGLKVSKAAEGVSGLKVLKALGRGAANPSKAVLGFYQGVA